MSNLEKLNQNQEIQTSTTEHSQDDMPTFDPEKANREKQIAKLEKTISEIENSKKFDKDAEYEISFEGFSPSSILKQIDKTAIDFSYDTVSSKYNDWLYDVVGIENDDDSENIYYDDEGNAYRDDDADDTKRYNAILDSLNDGALSNYDYWESDGFTMFNVQYSLDGQNDDAHYTADFLADKNEPLAMTTSAAKIILEHIKNPESEPPKDKIKTIAANKIAETFRVDILDLQKAAKNGETLPQFSRDKETDDDYSEGGRYHEALINEDYDEYDVAHELLEDAHVEWAKENEDKFFDPDYQDKLYLFLDQSFLRPKDINTLYLNSIQPFFNAVGFEVDAEAYLYDNEIYNRYEDDIEDGIDVARMLLENPANLLADPESTKIAKAIKDNPSLALFITKQVMENTPWVDQIDTDIIADRLGIDYEKFKDEFYNSREDDPYFTSQEYINDGWD